MSKGRLIVVSNRLPFRLGEKKLPVNFSPNAGGLVSSIRSYIRKVSHLPDSDKCVWVGTSDIPEAKFTARYSGNELVVDEFEIIPVFLPRKTEDKFYNGFCNDTIWPLFHYFPSYAKFLQEYYDEYKNANRIFADKIAAIYRPGDSIWIHDYHLMLLPELIRERLPDASIGFFLHIPFPSFEIFRLLPGIWRRELLLGILGADVVGFHTDDYVQHFTKSVRQVLGFEQKMRVIHTPLKSVSVDAFPISIDYDLFNKVSLDNDTFNERNKIKKRFYDAKLIISVDRLDYSKGLINRLESYELFLETYPDYRKKVVYIFMVVPSRDVIAKYKETKKEIEGLVSRINGKYGTIDWTPVVYQYKSMDMKRLVALYLSADVALITPMRDGMNLVAKEFVASRTDKRGVLILSEAAGASTELSEAMFVNPTDRGEIATVLSQALSMPLEEQIRRNESMQKRLRRFDVVRWAEQFVTQLNITKEKQEKLKVKKMNESYTSLIVDQYRKSKRRLFLLDYDGTLTPLVNTPQSAIPDSSVKDLLRSLSADEKNEVVIVSGRSKDILDEWLGDVPVSLVAEHGAFYKKTNAGWNSGKNVSVEWMSPVLDLFQTFQERCEGSLIETKSSSAAWHYRNAESELGFLRSRELINSLVELSVNLEFQIVEGHKVIEVRPRGINKGLAPVFFSREPAYDFILAIGDDKTDEDMFQSIPANQHTIRVGYVQSIAKYNFKNQKEVIPFLENFLAPGTG